MEVFVWINLPVIQSLHVGSLRNIPHVTLRLLLSIDIEGRILKKPLIRHGKTAFDWV